MSDVTPTDEVGGELSSGRGVEEGRRTVVGPFTKVIEHDHGHLSPHRLPPACIAGRDRRTYRVCAGRAYADCRRLLPALAAPVEWLDRLRAPAFGRVLFQ